MDKVIENTLNLALAAAPWLLGGFIAAGLIRAFVPQRWLVRALGQRGMGGLLKASVIGIPLPLCSCGVLPTAVSLRRQGASKSSTVSFLISTPEIGFDSFALSYALLGPIMAFTRPIAAFVSAVFAGFLALMVDRSDETIIESAHNGSASTCCSSENKQAETSSCCGSKASSSSDDGPVGFGAKLADGMGYVFSKLLDDIAKWLLVGLIVAGVMATFLHDNQWLIEHGSTGYAKAVMLLVGVPLYVCASSSTPVAAALLLAGISPGTVLVFLLAGPATNIGSLGVLRKELGMRVLLAYLAAIAISSVAAGMLLDAIIPAQSIFAQVHDTDTHEMLPLWVTVPPAVIMFVLAIRPLRRLVFSTFSKSGKPASAEAASCCSSPSSSDAQPAESSSCCSSKTSGSTQTSGPTEPAKASSGCCGHGQNDANA